MMSRIGLSWLAAALSLAACEKPTEDVTDEGPKEPVIVYAAFADDAALQPLFEEFTENTGALVIVRRGAAHDIVTDLIENRISPPADVLLTRSVTDIWRAAEEGALRPLFSEPIREKTPTWLRDADDLWFGLSYRAAVIAGNNTELAAGKLTNFAALAESRFAGSVCLSSSTNPINRAVIAMLIDEMGVRPAELTVRGWIRNLAMPPFDTEAQLLDAIQAGSCRLGIASSNAVATEAARRTSAGPAVAVPMTSYADVDGIGVARHARNPDGAAALIEWMFSTDVQSAYALQRLTYPADSSAEYSDTLDAAVTANVSQKSVGLVAWHEAEAIKLAERAHYR